MMEPTNENEGFEVSSSCIENESLLETLRNKVDFYLSKENLAMDTFLVSQMDVNSYIPIELIQNLNEIKEVTTDVQLLLEAISSSTMCSLNSEKTAVRPNMIVERSTIILRDIPSETSEEELRTFISAYCEDIKQIRLDVGNTWFVTFATEQEAMDTILALRAQKFKDQPIKARLKSENILKYINGKMQPNGTSSGFSASSGLSYKNEGYVSAPVNQFPGFYGPMNDYYHPAMYNGYAPNHFFMGPHVRGDRRGYYGRRYHNHTRYNQNLPRRDNNRIKTNGRPMMSGRRNNHNNSNNNNNNNSATNNNNNLPRKTERQENPRNKVNPISPNCTTNPGIPISLRDDDNVKSGRQPSFSTDSFPPLVDSSSEQTQELSNGNTNAEEIVSENATVLESVITSSPSSTVPAIEAIVKPKTMTMAGILREREQQKNGEQRNKKQNTTLVAEKESSADEMVSPTSNENENGNTNATVLKTANNVNTVDESLILVQSICDSKLTLVQDNEKEQDKENDNVTSTTKLTINTGQTLTTEKNEVVENSMPSPITNGAEIESEPLSEPQPQGQADLQSSSQAQPLKAAYADALKNGKPAAPSKIIPKTSPIANRKASEKQKPNEIGSTVKSETKSQSQNIDAHRKNGTSRQKEKSRAEHHRKKAKEDIVVVIPPVATTPTKTFTPSTNTWGDKPCLLQVLKAKAQGHVAVVPKKTETLEERPLEELPKAISTGISLSE